MPKKILVIRIDERVGNVVITTSLLRALQDRLPESQVDVLVARKMKDILRGFRGVIAFEKRRFFRNPFRFWALIWHLRTRQYDAVIDASHHHQFSTTSGLLLAATGAPMRIAHARQEAFRFATHAVPTPSEVEAELSTKMRLLGPLGIAGLRPPKMQVELGTTGPAVDKIRGWMKPWEALKLRTILVPGARKPDHRAPMAFFGLLVRHIFERGGVPIVVWGPTEHGLAKQLCTDTGAEMAPPTSLDEVAALFRRATAVVVNDTGLMHLAAACDAPTLSLYTVSDPKRWKPPGDRHIAVEVPLSSPDQVVSAFNRMLQALTGNGRA